MTTIDTIRAEIERRKEEASIGLSEYDAGYENGICETCNDLLSFLSTLESDESKKPNQEGLDEEIAGMYQALFGTDIINRKEMLYLDTFEAIARHFAKWGAEHTPLPEDTVLFNKGVEEGKRLIMEDAVKWLVDDDYHEAWEKGRFILGSVGLGYNGYYIPYLDLLKLPKED